MIDTSTCLVKGRKDVYDSYLINALYHRISCVD